MKKKFYSISKAAELLGVHFETVRNWTRNGKIKFIRTPGGHRRISHKEIERLTADSVVED